MTHENFHLDHFSHSILLNKDCEMVFRSISTVNGLCAWFLGEVIYRSDEGQEKGSDLPAQKGDHFVWKWLGKDFTLEGEILKVKADESIAFSFGDRFEVSIGLKPISDGRTQLTLRQAHTGEVPAQISFAYINCCVCWVFFLTNLKSVLEYGIDLRETEIENEDFVNQ